MMKSSLIRINLIFILLALFIPNLTSAEIKTFIKEYTFNAGDEDSKNSSRIVALREVKRLLLEELGTYLESETEVQNFKLTKDQITTMTAGIVQTKLVEETWNGKKYWLKAKIAVDSDEVIKSIDSLRKDRQKTKELEEIRKRSDNLLKENERLRKELVMAKGKRKQDMAAAYNKTIERLSASEWVERGLAPANSELWSNADAMREAIDANSKAIKLDPNFAEAYNLRGLAYDMLGNRNQAIKDYSKAIVLNPQFEWAYLNRSVAYYNLGKTTLAMKDNEKAEKLRLKDAKAYYHRGLEYYNLGNHIPAIQDFDRAIELNPQYADAYNNRAAAYNALGDRDQAINDLKKAALLGVQGAQEYLRKQGIDW